MSRYGDGCASKANLRLLVWIGILRTAEELPFAQHVGFWMYRSLSAGGTRARQRYRLLKDLSERFGTQERYSPGCGFLVGRVQRAGVCRLKSEHVPKIRFLLACRRSSGGVDSCIPRLFGKLDPNANFKEKDKEED
jgi:hypothetical protein